MQPRWRRGLYARHEREWMTYRRILEDSIINYYVFQHYDEKQRSSLPARWEITRLTILCYYYRINLITRMLYRWIILHDWEIYRLLWATTELLTESANLSSGSTLLLVCILCKRHKIARVASPRKSLIRLYVQQSAQQKSGSTSHERVRCCPKLWRDGEVDRDDTERNGEIERNRANRMLPRGDDEEGSAFDARWMQRTKNLGYFRVRSFAVGYKIYTKIQTHDKY